mgnify:FL=1
MTRACDLGPGDLPHPDESPDICECGAKEDFDDEFCTHGACRECREAAECCVTCSVCHALTDEYEVDEGVDPTCVNCLVADEERKNARRERWAAMLEDKGDEMREAYGTPRRSN